MIPIDIDSWPHVNRELKEKLWLDVKVINYTTDTHNLFLIIFIVFYFIVDRARLKLLLRVRAWCSSPQEKSGGNLKQI